MIGRSWVVPAVSSRAHPKIVVIGAKQRVMIARALYRAPKILVLDEGTAHLDPVCESKVIEILRSLPITRLAVAHGRAIADAADRVFELKGGVLREVRYRSADLEVY